MSLHRLKKIVRTKRRRGRGIGSHGAKSGRGMKGQRARAGFHLRAGFEGGQTPLYQRLPKARGAKQIFSSRVKKPVAVSTEDLAELALNGIVGLGTLRSAGVMLDKNTKVKLIGNVPLKKKLTVRVHSATAGATRAVEAGGGSVEIIESLT